MKKATLKISKLTNRKNGYGMPIVEVTSDADIKIINIGYNEFQAVNEIDESDLYRLRQYFHSFSNETVMLEITSPTKKTNCWYKLTEIYLSGDKTGKSCIIW